MKKILLSVAMLLSAAGVKAMVSLPKVPLIVPQSKYDQQPMSMIAPSVASRQQVASMFDIDQKTQPVNCLPQGTSYTDEAARAWAGYNACIKGNACNMRAPTGPQNSPKYGPGHPTYEQYKACAIKNKQTPAAVIYSTGFF